MMVINNSGGLVSDFHHVPPVLNGSHCGGRTSIDDQEMMNGVCFLCILTPNYIDSKVGYLVHQTTA